MSERTSVRSTFWSIYLLSSMAERLEWSQEEDEADGRRRNKQLVSCCWRSMNCFIKLSLEYTSNGTHTHTEVMNCNALLPTEEIHTLKGRRNRTFVLEPNHLCANSAANMSEESLPAATWQMDCRGGFLGEWRTQLCNNQQLNYEIDYEVHCAGYSLILAKTVLLLNTPQGSEIFFYGSFLKSCQYCSWHLHFFLVFPQ